MTLGALSCFPLFHKQFRQEPSCWRSVIGWWNAHCYLKAVRIISELVRYKMRGGWHALYCPSRPLPLPLPPLLLPSSSGLCWNSPNAQTEWFQWTLVKQLDTICVDVGQNRGMMGAELRPQVCESETTHVLEGLKSPLWLHEPGYHLADIISTFIYSGASEPWGGCWVAGPKWLIHSHKGFGSTNSIYTGYSGKPHHAGELVSGENCTEFGGNPQKDEFPFTGSR